MRLTSLSKNIIQFCRYLRQKGFTAGIEEETLILQSLQQFDFRQQESFFLLLKAIICRSKSQIDEFEKLFKDYWKQLDKEVNAKQKERTKKKKQPTPRAQLASLNAWLKGNHKKGTEETAAYSNIKQTLSQKDFSAVPDDDIEELMKVISNLSKRLAAKTNRRYEASNKIDLPDLRQTLRKNLRRGGELIDIMHRRTKRNRVKLLMLCDVSQSMELYAAFLLQFMYAFQQVYNKMETFVFSTSLKKITPLLKQKDFRDAMDWLSMEQNEWHGGTRIGESLNTFVNDYGAKLVDSKTIVIILSDGWDTGNIDLLQKSMHIIHTKAKKVVWLNPLAGYAAYRPEVAGMKAAMPYIDVFAPVYNAESLRKLARFL